MKAYLQLLRHVLERGHNHTDRTGVGTLSVFGYQLRHDMAHGFPLLTTKSVPPRWVAEELFWILRGDTDERNLRAEGVDIWAEWATDEKCRKFGRSKGDLGPVYGWQLRHFGAKYVPLNIFSDPARRQMAIHGEGHDQLWHLLYDLQNNPHSRRHVVSMWNPAQVNEVELPPCHTLYQLKVGEALHSPLCESHDGPCTCGTRPTLHLELFARSIDSFLGLPFNVASYGLLLALLAHVCDFNRGELVISFGDLHIYRNHLAQVSEQLTRNPFNLPTLTISERLRGQFLTGLLSTTWADLKFEGYKHWPKIEAEVAV